MYRTEMTDRVVPLTWAGAGRWPALGCVSLLWAVAVEESWACMAMALLEVLWDTLDSRGIGDSLGDCGTSLTTHWASLA